MISRDDLSQLTKREQQVLSLISEGKSSKMIARELFIAKSTVDVHSNNILEKLEMDNRVQAAVWYTKATQRRYLN